MKEIPSLRAVCLLLGLVSAAALMLSSCDATIPPAPDRSMPFTLYGVLTPEADTQWVRVFPVQKMLRPEGAPDLQARFTSIDRSTGERRRWRDSLFQEEDGRYVHVFWAPFRAERGHTYHLAVERPDGSSTTAKVTVPPDVALEREGEASVHVNGAPRLLKIEVQYHVRYQTGSDRTLPVSLFYDGAQEPREEGWLIPIYLSGARSVIEGRMRNCNISFDQITIDRMTLRMMVVNEPWVPPPGEFKRPLKPLCAKPPPRRGPGTFDPEILVEPKTMSNVENGFGFVGAGYRFTADITPPEEVLGASPRPSDK